jgi:hypothetical protein
MRSGAVISMNALWPRWAGGSLVTEASGRVVERPGRAGFQREPRPLGGDSRLKADQALSVGGMAGGLAGRVDRSGDLQVVYAGAASGGSP